MTDHGLKILNDDLKLQIDSLYTNYALWEHGENVSTAGAGMYKSVTVTFANSIAQPPLIAIKPSASDYCGLSHYTKSGADYTGFVVHSIINTVVTFDWQAFVPRVDKSSEAYGLRVYNAGGVLVFDSGHAPMIILDVDAVSPAFDAVVSIAHPSDANAYFIMTPWGLMMRGEGWYMPPGVTHMCYYFAMLKYLNATTVSFGGRMAFYGSIPDQNLVGWYGGFWPSLWTIITVKKAS